MATSEVTLGAVFKTKETGISKSDREDLEQDEDLISIKNNIVQDLSSRHWKILLSEIGANLTDCLDIGIPDILLNAWKKTNVLARYCDKQKYPPSEIILVPLAEHVIESEHHPAIEVYLKKRQIGTIDFTVRLKFMLEGFMLIIQDCKIKSIKSGTCQASGIIQFKNLTITEVKTKEITLPGKVQLNEGIAIGM